MATKFPALAGSDQSNGRVQASFADAVSQQLRELRELPANWDAFGARPISADLIDTARAFVAALPEIAVTAPRVVPISAGNLQLEWHRGPKVLELEFETPQTIRYLQWDPSAGIDVEDEIAASDIDSAVGLIRWFESGASVIRAPTFV